jgi:hypothetical protein
MNDSPTLMRELQSNHADEVPLVALEEYCRRYLHYYHRHVEQQPVRFYGAWGWSETRRREFRKALHDWLEGRERLTRFTNSLESTTRLHH